MNSILEKDIQSFLNQFPFESEIVDSVCLITGATGLIGSTIVRCLHALNEFHKSKVTIIGLIRDIEKAQKMFPTENVTWIQRDLSEPVNLPIEKVDYIFHCACPSSSKFYVQNPVELIKTSVQGSISMLDFAKSHHIKGMVYLSSCEIYGSVLEDNGPFSEEYSGYIDTIDVRSGYPMAKRLIETLCHSYYKEYGVPVNIARLTQTFGAGVSQDDNRVFAQFAKSAIKEEDIILHTEGYSAKPYCYTIDAVMALFFLVFKGEKGEAYNIANQDTYISIRDLAKYIAKNFTKSSNVQIELASNMGYAPVTKLNMSTAKIKSLGWKPYYSLKDMFKNLIDYYKILESL